MSEFNCDCVLFSRSLLLVTLEWLSEWTTGNISSLFIDTLGDQWRFSGKLRYSVSPRVSTSVVTENKMFTSEHVDLVPVGCKHSRSSNSS